MVLKIDQELNNNFSDGPRRQITATAGVQNAVRATKLVQHHRI